MKDCETNDARNKRKKRLEAWDQSEIFRQTQNMKIYFLMLTRHQTIDFKCFTHLTFFFSFKLHKNICKLIVLVLFIVNWHWAVIWFFYWKHYLKDSIKSFWVWLLSTIICLDIYHQYVTAIELEAQLESLEIYFVEKEVIFTLILLRK